MSLRLKKRGEKALERALGGVVPDEDQELVRSGTVRRRERDSEEGTISEFDEQSSVSASRLHRRETAESGQWP